MTTFEEKIEGNFEEIMERVFSDYVDLDKFTRVPEKYPIDNLDSFGIFGLDFKVTPENHVVLIEMNSHRSGMRGFDELRITAEPVGEVPDCMISSLLENREEGSKIPDDPIVLRKITQRVFERMHSPENQMRMLFSEIGREPMGYIAARLINEGYHPLRMHGGHNILERFPKLAGMDSGWNIYDRFVKALIRIEECTVDKLKGDTFFEDYRDLKPKSVVYSPENVRELVARYDPKFVVLKPRDGQCGKGFMAVTADTKDLPTLENYIAEPFIPSKPLLSSRTGQLHDGCMRYIVTVFQQKGTIAIGHYGGYWRLCPNPQTDKLDIDAMRANLAQGAMTEKVSDADLKIVENVVDKIMPKIYTTMTNPASVTN